MNNKITNRWAKSRSNTLLLSGFLLLAISACGQNQTRPQLQGLEANKPISVKYKVQRGDNLAKIAQKLTGDPENWAAIATINNITQPKTMSIGMILEIPDYLFPEMAQTQSSSSNGKKRVLDNPAEVPVVILESVAVEAQSVTTERKPTRSRKEWIFQASSLPGKLEIPAVVHRAVANRTFNIERIQASETTNTAATHTAPTVSTAADGADAKMIRVIGTYYPKGIYSQPSYTSVLLMRVAPGTQLKLEKSFGEWLQIRTDKGSGYIRKIDAEVIGSIENKVLLLSNNG